MRGRHTIQARTDMGYEEDMRIARLRAHPDMASLDIKITKCPAERIQRAAQLARLVITGRIALRHDSGRTRPTLLAPEPDATLPSWAVWRTKTAIVIEWL